MQALLESEFLNSFFTPASKAYLKGEKYFKKNQSGILLFVTRTPAVRVKGIRKSGAITEANSILGAIIEQNMPKLVPFIPVKTAIQTNTKKFSELLLKSIVQ